MVGPFVHSPSLYGGWEWRSLQDGTNGDETFEAATVSTDSTVVLAGFSSGSWSIVNQGSNNFAAVKLAADGSEMWKWQVKYVPLRNAPSDPAGHSAM